MAGKWSKLPCSLWVLIKSTAGNQISIWDVNSRQVSVSSTSSYSNWNPGYDKYFIIQMIANAISGILMSVAREYLNIKLMQMSIIQKFQVGERRDWSHLNYITCISADLYTLKCVYLVFLISRSRRRNCLYQYRSFISYLQSTFYQWQKRKK